MSKSLKKMNYTNHFTIKQHNTTNKLLIYSTMSQGTLFLSFIEKKMAVAFGNNSLAVSQHT